MYRVKSPIIVKKNKKFFAIAVLNNHKYKNLKFYTKNKTDFQFATMFKLKDEIIEKHEHFREPKIIRTISKFMFIKSGKILVQIFESIKSKKKLKSIILNSGDCILFFYGAMSFKILKKTKIIEIKQGPHKPLRDKIYEKN